MHSPPRTGFGRNSELLREEAHILLKFHDWRSPGTPRSYAAALLSQAQHYGAPTRLLDVSANPLVALYFACWSGDPDQAKNADGVVWAYPGLGSVRTQFLNRRDVGEHSYEDGISENFLDFFEPWLAGKFGGWGYSGYRHYRPSIEEEAVNARLRSQNGSFLWKPMKWTAGDTKECTHVKGRPK